MRYLNELQQIVRRVNPACRDANLDQNTLLLEERILDSLQIVAMIAEIETSFGVRVKLDDVIPENFETLQSIEQMILRSSKSSDTSENL